jgi:hypothetical protein
MNNLMQNETKKSGLFLTGSTNKIPKKIETIPEDLNEESQIQLQEFKAKLVKELNQIIKIEKEKEEERLKNHSIEADEEIKKILEDSINKDRLISSRKVMEFNEYFF